MFRNRKIVWMILILIVCFGAILRLWQLGNVPPSPDWDEAALGYDAYSIMTTGRDEFGKFFPVVLRSFDDYKPALYAYLAIPPVFLLGLSTFAVRLPSALSGILMIIVIFYLVRELFKESKYKDYLSLAAAFLFAISPWSIQFSRVGFESNVGVLLNSLTVLFFLKGLKKPWLLFMAAFFAGLGPYIYQSEKAFTPLLVLALVIIYWKQLFLLPKKYIIGAVVIGLIVVAPMVIYIVTNQEALLRISGTSVFTYKTELLEDNIEKLSRDHANGDILGVVLDNRRFVYAKTIIGGYLSHFDLNFLFIKGDIARHHATGMGLLYLFELPLILLGVYKLIFGAFNKRTKLIVFAWFLLAAVPASITVGVPHAVRTLNFLPTYQIIGGVGLVAFIMYVLSIQYRVFSIKFKYLVIIIGCMFALFNFTYYLNQYFVQTNYYDSSEWQYGYEQAVKYAQENGGKYDEIVVSDDQPLDKSYMFFLYYLKYPAADYQKLGSNSSGGFASHHNFGKYTFRPIDWEKDSLKKNTLFIGKPSEIPLGVSKKTINNLDGAPAIRISGT